MKKKIAQLEREIASMSLQHTDQKRLFKQRFLSKKGQIASLFNQLIALPTATKKELGPLVNGLKVKATARYQAEGITSSSTQSEKKDILDYTLPPSYVTPGQVHPLTRVQRQITTILERIGFVAVEGPEVEDEWHNFTALNFSSHHPARDMQDTFFVLKGKNVALRTHTSSVQIRVLEKGNLPIRILSLGRVFRHEAISARSHCIFHQVEGLYVNRDVTFVDLKATLYYLVRALFGSDVDVRFRPSYFPFTEPSAEVDIMCLLCRGKGCALCKQSGWVELGGAGMVDPHVLEHCKVDSATYRGYAFGIGIERIAMLLYRIPDIRLFTENHKAFLAQFRGK